jgi:fructose-1,6-bisphosphatase
MEEHPDSIRNDTNSKTLSRLLMIRTKDGELVLLLNALQTACKLVARSVRKAGIAGLCKYHCHVNILLLVTNDH